MEFKTKILCDGAHSRWAMSFQLNFEKFLTSLTIVQALLTLYKTSDWLTLSSSIIEIELAIMSLINHHIKKKLARIQVEMMMRYLTESRSIPSRHKLSVKIQDISSLSVFGTHPKRWARFAWTWTSKTRLHVCVEKIMIICNLNGIVPIVDVKNYIDN